MNITEPLFDENEIRLVREVLDSKWVTQGPKTGEFEKLFARFQRSDHALATTSCTAALHLSALALGLQPGDEVVVPAFTWVTSAHTAEYVGAKVVFADIDLSTFNISPKALEAAITPKTKAIVVVHLFGKAAEMDEIMKIAERHNLAVIEDAACAIGTSYKGNFVGNFGDIGCFSFHPRKAITTGEGGMVTTKHQKLAQRVQCLRNHGATGPVFGADPSKPYAMSTFDMLGFNLRLSDIQAAVGVAQMSKLEGILNERRSLALCYSELLADVDELVLPADDEGHTYQSYVVRTKTGDCSRRNSIMEHLASNNIQTRPGTHAVHRLGYYAEKYSLRPSEFPNASRAEDTTITLPIFPGMSHDQQVFVVDSIMSALN
ncbi:MAG: DegT/DnrJ/EryC1/StrS family aminotransferase [Rhodospirillales bacterium]|nr:DegT/DnrJ/EryC1/StrS family aminotransferase [Rhodospirillales bacterium]